VPSTRLGSELSGKVWQQGISNFKIGHGQCEHLRARTMSISMRLGLSLFSVVQCGISVSAFLLPSSSGPARHWNSFDSRPLAISSRIRQTALLDLVMGRIGSRKSIDSYSNRESKPESFSGSSLKVRQVFPEFHCAKSQV
jgi:hypothetical protein